MRWGGPLKPLEHLLTNDGEECRNMYPKCWVHTVYQQLKSQGMEYLGFRARVVAYRITSTKLEIVRDASKQASEQAN